MAKKFYYGKKSNSGRFKNGHSTNNLNYKNHTNENEFHQNESYSMNPPHLNKNEENRQISYGHLDNETKTYFLSIGTKLDQPEFINQNDEEGTQLFLSNVYEELDGKELLLATDIECSMVLEKLLRVSSGIHLRIFLHRLSGNYTNLFRHFCASHVCQTCLILAANFLDAEAEEVNSIENEDPSQLPTMTSIFHTMLLQLRSFWYELAADKYATFLVRTLLSILHGDPITPSNLRSKKSKAWGMHHNLIHTTQNPSKIASKKIPIPLLPFQSSVLEELIQSMSPYYHSLVFNASMSPVLTLLLSYSKTPQDIIHSIFKLSNRTNAFEELKEKSQSDYVHRVMTHPSASRVFEKILELSEPALFHFFLIEFFRSNLLHLCRHPNANFLVQTLITHVRNENQLELLLEELSPHFDTLLFQGRPLIVFSFLQASLKYPTKSRAILKALYQCLQFDRKTMFPKLFFLTRDPFTNKDPLVSPSGCQLLSFIFKLPSVCHQELVDSFLAQEMHWYHSYLRHPTATFMFEAFLLSPTINLTPKRKLLFSLLHHDHQASNPSQSNLNLKTLAMDKHGSHLVDAFWKAMDLNTKKQMASFLAVYGTVLNETLYGQCIWRNCGLTQFKQHQEAWEHKQHTFESKKRLFHEQDWQPLDEIDAVFLKAKKQMHQGSLSNDTQVQYIPNDPSCTSSDFVLNSNELQSDSQLSNMLEAIVATKKKKKQKQKSKIKETKQSS